jgi:hypothetical protein
VVLRYRRELTAAARLGVVDGEGSALRLTIRLDSGQRLVERASGFLYRGGVEIREAAVDRVERGDQGVVVDEQSGVR